MKLLKQILIILLGVLSLTVAPFIGLFLWEAQFINPFVRYTPLDTGQIYYKSDSNIIASNVLGYKESWGKVYYITLDGVGIFNEISLKNVFINREELSLPQNINKFNDIYRGEIKLSIDEEEELNSLYFSAFESRYDSSQGRMILYPFYLSGLTHEIIDLSKGERICRFDKFKLINNSFYNASFGVITKIDLTNKTVQKYYSYKLLGYNFLESNPGDGLVEREKSNLNKKLNYDKENRKSIRILDSYDEFSSEDKVVIEQLVLEMVNARKTMNSENISKGGLTLYLE